MRPKFILLVVSLFLLGLTASAQYTEKINSNRPGGSQGAFAVGNNVLQGEGGFTYGKQKHSLLKTKTSVFYVDYAVRYGLLMERLEINLIGRFRTEGIKQTIGANEEKIRKTDFEYNTIGAKYLIYDPYKRPKENDSLDLVKRKSWKEHYKFRLSSLIPAVSAYVGMNYVNSENAFTFANDPTISPKFVIMTQNNWWTGKAGSWVLVTNFIVDKVTSDNPAIGWFVTSTHTINEKWAVFGEYQGQKSNFYSDNLLRLGGAYLFDKNFQLDANITTNFKDTPSIFTVSVGGSYRFDWHTKDELILPPGFRSGIKKMNKEAQEGEEGDEDEDIGEFEEIENDSLKQERTPFINPFEDDTSVRDAMELDLDERRTAQRIERERLEQEKIDKKNDKKFQKEERRRLKREAKEAKQAEKARIRAEKEKAKMIDDIDAELDKIEQDDGSGSLEDELNKLEEDLLKLEQEANPDAQPDNGTEQETKPEEVGNSDADIELDNQKAAKFEEKRRAKEEKKRQKEEKKRKKEEEKRKKAEAKQKKKNEQIDEELDDIDGF